MEDIEKLNKEEVAQIEAAIERYPHNSWSALEVLELVATIKDLEEQRLLLKHAVRAAFGYFGEQGIHPANNHPDSHHYERLSDALLKTGG